MISNIIGNRSYLGEFYFRGTDSETGKPNNFEFNYPHLRIIDDETWNIAQIQRKRNAELARQNKKHDYLLAGYLKCVCGLRLFGKPMIAKYTTKAGEDREYLHLRYSCNGFGHPHMKRPRSCINLATVPIDEKVWNWVYNISRDENASRMAIRQTISQTETQLQPKRQRLKSVRNLLETTEAKMRRLASRLGDEEDEIITETYQANLNAAKKQREDLLKQKSLLEAELNRRAITVEMAERIIQQISGLAKQKIDDADLQTKRDVLEKIKFQGQIREGENGQYILDITCVFLLEPFSIGLNNDV